MRLDSLPIWAEFAFTILLVLGALEVGYRIGRARHRREKEEKESPVSAIAGVILGLTSFMLAFTFGIVSARHDARVTLVRDDAVAIRIAWLRSDFLPDADRAQAKALLRQYVDQCLIFALTGVDEADRVKEVLSQTQQIQDRLWSMAASSARREMNPTLAVSYAEALNEVTRLHAARVALGLRSRVPGAIWIVLYCIATLGMASVGYQAGIAGSSRSLVWHLLALAFALVFPLIVALDRPVSDIMKISQRPLIELRDSMSASSSG